METNASVLHPTTTVICRPVGQQPNDEPFDLFSDQGRARAVDRILRQVPRTLPVQGREFPLLRALGAVNASGQALARQLTLVGATIHDEADERRTAEYLLRHRDDVESGRRSAHSLVRSARCAAEMDLRRIQLREVPAEFDAIAPSAADATHDRLEDPSVGEVVLDLLERAVGPYRIEEELRCHLVDAVVIALDLAERHALNGGAGPSLIAMRPAARKHARLGDALRAEFGDRVTARAVARLLIGSDGTDLSTALLYWAAHPGLAASDIPAVTKRHWLRDLELAAGTASHSVA